MKYVLVHGASHDGSHFKATADAIREQGHEVFCPTLRGNNPNDDRQTTTLSDAIQSLIDYFEENDIYDAVLLGHSWGGIVITGAVDKLSPGRVRRLIYFSAFVPNNDESLIDMCPPHYQALFNEMGEATGEITFPFPVFRDAFINDGTAEQAQALFDGLNPQSYLTMADKIDLSINPAEMQIGKSVLYAREDCALPQSCGFHPHLSEKLGLFRLVTMEGSHSVFHTAHKKLAMKIIEAGRD